MVLTATMCDAPYIKEFENNASAYDKPDQAADSCVPILGCGRNAIEKDIGQTPRPCVDSGQIIIIITVYLLQALYSQKIYQLTSNSVHWTFKLSDSI